MVLWGSAMSIGFAIYIDIVLMLCWPSYCVVCTCCEGVADALELWTFNGNPEDGIKYAETYVGTEINKKV